MPELPWRALFWYRCGIPGIAARTQALNSAQATRVNIRKIDGKSIWVIDGLFAPFVVDMFYALFRDQKYSCQEIDSDATLSHINWSVDFDQQVVAENRELRHLASTVAAQVEACFPGEQFDLQRFYCNAISFADHMHAHPDIVGGVTALYYANARWDDDFHGETLFYSLAGEPVVAVAPRPGRLVIFPGEIRHRAGMPSRTCMERRLSVAFKFDRNADSSMSQP